jgi:hypothetical protein
VITALVAPLAIEPVPAASVTWLILANDKPCQLEIGGRYKSIAVRILLQSHNDIIRQTHDGLNEELPPMRTGRACIDLKLMPCRRINRLP